jgi:superfamily II DNA helicase RecQ
LRKINTTAQLQQIIGKTAKFRSVQKKAVAAIVARESPVVAVIPTGGEKSLLFILLA